MRYQGGKTRLAKEIAAAIVKHTPDGYDKYLEPFVGGGSMLAAVCATNRFKQITASDIHPALITMWKALQEGWIPPDTVTEQQYRYYQRLKDDSNPLTAFIGFGCSFIGRYYEGKARSNKGDYVRQAKTSLLTRVTVMQFVSFYCAGFDWYSPEQTVIYADPPYAGTKPYSKLPTFEHAKFWQKMQEYANAGNIVFVSEINCSDSVPHDVVWSKRHNLSVSSQKTKGESRIEKLFLIKAV